MCGLCGVLGGEEHWTSAAGRPEIFGNALTRRAERFERLRVTNAVLGCFAYRADDFQGASFIVKNATGRQEMALALPEIWQQAAAMLGRPIDPLDEGLLVRLESGAA
jgi:hypothetical protein